MSAMRIIMARRGVLGQVFEAPTGIETPHTVIERMRNDSEACHFGERAQGGNEGESQ